VWSRQLAKVLDPFCLDQNLTAVASSDLRDANLPCLLCARSEHNLAIGADGFSSRDARPGAQEDPLCQPELQSQSEYGQSQCTDCFI